MDNQKDQETSNLNPQLEKPALTLDQSLIYPPLDQARLYPIEIGELLKPKQLQAISQLITKPFAEFPDGYCKSLSIPETTGQTTVFKKIGNLSFEKINDGVLISVELENAKPQKILIKANGQIQSDVFNSQELEQLFKKIFQIDGEKVDFTSIVSKGFVSLPYVRQKTVNNIEGQELADYEGPMAEFEQVNSLAYELISNFAEMPEIPDIDRQAIFQEAYKCVAKDFFDKASDQSQKLFELLKNKRMVFLNNEDYQVFQSVVNSEENKKNTHAITIFKGLIVFNQESLLDDASNPKIIKAYNLIKRQNITLTNNREALLALVAEYIPYRYNITEKAIDPNFLIEKKDNDQDRKDYIEQMMWSIIYHECLHVLSGNNQFTPILREAATHYYTVQATLKNKGPAAFGAYLIFTGLDSVIKWLRFMRDFKVDQQQAEEMYFNRDSKWTISNMLTLFPEKKDNFFNLLNRGELPKFS